ncbi:hypothetical protein EWM64_g473 [Hericium alpestre]|uniref:Cytochrome P450 n=1 Tax=Hericium alpestre TaxID=135208 RepID=A0A4Z0A8X8_9AGAM|nr:hypothetical protein EWM64_g473 [Hericium alpestre]
MASMSGWGGLLPMVPAGKRLKQTRTYLHKGLNANALEKYLPVIQRNAAIFVKRVLDRPDKVLPELRRAVNVGIGRITYGLELSPVNAPFVELAEKGLQSFEQSTRPGSWLVDLFTSLRHLPSWFPAPFIRRAREWRTDVVHRITTEPLIQALDEIAQGKGETSVISEITEDLHDLKSNEELMDIIKWTATSSYLGGSDTSISTLSTFVLAMILNPDVQRKAQAEIDSVVGSERLPEFSDRLAVRGVHPEGSFSLEAVGAHGGMLQDGDTYESPDEFRPERHMEGKVLDPTGPTFGYGRRVCPGMAVAQRSLWMIIVTALATVEFGCQIASDSTEVKPEVRYNNLPVQQPLPFPSAVRPRSEAKVELIERALWL